VCELLKDFLGVKCQMIGNKFITEQVCKEERSLQLKKWFQIWLIGW